MGHVIDMEVKDGYNVKILDENGKLLCDNNETTPLRDCLDFELYGQVDTQPIQNSQFQITINDTVYSFDDEQDHKKVILCFKVKNGWKIEVEDGQKKKIQPKFTLWKRLDGDDLCLELFGWPVCC